MSTLIGHFPQDDDVVHLRTGNKVSIRSADGVMTLQFHSTADAFAWLARVTADLFVLAYPADEVP